MSPLLQKVTFDTVHPFRRHPWLYGLIVFVCVGIVALLVFGAWYGNNQRKSGTSLIPPAGHFETPAEKQDRLALMNILNSFHLEEATISPKDPLKERRAAQEQHIKSVISRLEAIEADSANRSAQNELLTVFKQWDEKLSHASSTADLKPDLVKIASKYPWLNALVWLLILNRL